MRERERVRKRESDRERQGERECEREGERESERGREREEEGLNEIMIQQKRVDERDRGRAGVEWLPFKIEE